MLPCPIPGSTCASPGPMLHVLFSKGDSGDSGWCSKGESAGMLHIRSPRGSSEGDSGRCCLWRSEKLALKLVLMRATWAALRGMSACMMCSFLSLARKKEGLGFSGGGGGSSTLACNTCPRHARVRWPCPSHWTGAGMTESMPRRRHGRVSAAVHAPAVQARVTRPRHAPACPGAWLNKHAPGQ